MVFGSYFGIHTWEEKGLWTIFFCICDFNFLLIMWVNSVLVDFYFNNVKGFELSNYFPLLLWMTNFYDAV